MLKSHILVIKLNLINFLIVEMPTRIKVVAHRYNFRLSLDLSHLSFFWGVEAIKVVQYNRGRKIRSKI